MAFIPVRVTACNGMLLGKVVAEVPVNVLISPCSEGMCLVARGR